MHYTQMTRQELLKEKQTLTNEISEIRHWLYLNPRANEIEITQHQRAIEDRISNMKLINLILQKNDLPVLTKAPESTQKSDTLF